MRTELSPAALAEVLTRADWEYHRQQFADDEPSPGNYFEFLARAAIGAVV